MRTRVLGGQFGLGEGSFLVLFFVFLRSLMLGVGGWILVFFGGQDWEVGWRWGWLMPNLFGYSHMTSFLLAVMEHKLLTCLMEGSMIH